MSIYIQHGGKTGEAFDKFSKWPFLYFDGNSFKCKFKNNDEFYAVIIFSRYSDKILIRKLYYESTYWGQRSIWMTPGELINLLEPEDARKILFNLDLFE